MMANGASASEPVVEINDLYFNYNGAPILENVNLSFFERDFIWIVGPNGGGKTTLLKLVLGLLRPTRGRVRVLGQRPEAARREIGYMPQHTRFDPKFPVTVMDVALMGRLGNGGRVGSYSSADKRIARDALHLVGLDPAGDKPLAELSGGQYRRLLIARALTAEPKILLLDEPTANLDLQVERDLFQILKKLNERLTIITVSHDPAFVSDFVEKVVCVKGTVAVHPTTQLQGTALDELYGSPMRMVRHDKHQDHD